MTSKTGGCTATDDVQIIVKQTPKTDAGTEVNICLGSKYELIATGGTTFKWSNNSNYYKTSVAPTITTTYTATSYIGSCYSVDDVVVNVIPSSDISVCCGKFINKGESANLNISGTGKIKWSTGDTIPSITVKPCKSTVYSATVDNGICTYMDTVKISVIGNSNSVSIFGNWIMIKGTSNILSVITKDKIKWSTGDTTETVNVKPVKDSLFKVSVTGITGCPNEGSKTIKVLDSCYVSLGPDKNICTGTTTSINASSAMEYTWKTDSVFKYWSSSYLNVKPTTSVTYYITAKIGACIATDDIVISVCKKTYI